MEDDASAAATDAVSEVLGDDLLVEILLRVGFPTTLVRAAAVCKRWLHHVSDKAFLRRFRKLNPPRLLGFYIERFLGSPRFVPMLPQPPELAAAVRIVEGYGLCTDKESVVIRNCRNGSVFAELRSSRSGFKVRHELHSPLCPEKAMAIDSLLSLQPPTACSTQILSREEKGGGLSFFYVMMEFPMGKETTDMTTKYTARVYLLQDGILCMHTSATTQIPHRRGGLGAVLVNNKIYMMTCFEITVLDLTNSTFSAIQLPQRGLDWMISRADDASSVYLIGVKEHQLGIWLHKGESWSIVDTFCLREMCSNLMVSDCRVKDVCTSRLRINQVGDNAEFVLLQMGRFVLYLDTRCRTLRTLCKFSEDEPYSDIIRMQPFTMIWPPTFPALKCGSTSNAM